MSAAGPPARRGLFAAEIVALVATTVVDEVLAVRADRPGGGLVATILVNLVPYVGTAVAVLAVLRRRFPRRIGRLGSAVVGFSVLSTVGSAIANGAGVGQQGPPVGTEVLAAVLLVGAGCRRLRPARAAALAVAAGAAVVAAPIVRFGPDSPSALLAAPASGLILGDADTRHLHALTEVRTNERLQLARELHDLVTHYFSGIVVRVQAARALSGNPRAPVQDPVEVYGEIEEAGAEALLAMRRLVGMLRSSEHALPPPSAGLGDVVRTAAADRASVDLTDDVDSMAVPPQLSSTIHRIVLESMTNVRRHGPPGAQARVGVRIENDELVLDVSNDLGATQPPDRGAGYGIIGMTERVTTLGGTLDAGPRPDGRWHTVARLPLGPEETPFEHLPRGV